MNYLLESDHNIGNMDEIILRNLFRNIDVSSLNNAQQAMAFYKLAIELERMKEPDIKDYYDYPINFHRNDRIMLIDFPCNDAFYQLFEKNRNPRETKFPSDLYIGLKIQTGNVAYRLLNMVIDHNDIKTIFIEEELLPVRIADFEVNLKEASRLELLPETIENINAGIKANPTWQGLLSVLRAEISEDVTVTNNLFLALSSKSIELSQIYSELNSHHLQASLGPGVTRNPFLESRRREMPRQHSLLESFLLNESIDNAIESVDVDSLLCVTKLDDSQKRAIADALGTRLSVITGAPGTGKTQVIENLLANALIRGKKVLVASKNNKAVDNVKERFDEIDKTGYFLRFGARQLVTTSTLPSIERILLEIGRLQDNSGEYDACKAQYEPAKKADIQSVLRQIEPEHISNVEYIERKHSEMLPLRDSTIEELNRHLSKIKTLDNNLTAKFTGFFGFWHRTFSVKKSAALLLNEVESLPLALKAFSSALFLEILPFPSRLLPALAGLDSIFHPHSSMKNHALVFR